MSICQPYFDNVTTISSGLLNTLNGIMLFPKPLLIIIDVLLIVWTPSVNLGKKPWSGATNPPINGSLNWPPWACPEKIKSTLLSEYISNNSGLWESNILKLVLPSVSVFNKFLVSTLSPYSNQSYLIN